MVGDLRQRARTDARARMHAQIVGSANLRPTVKFIVHSPTNPEKSEVFYGIRMFFAAYSPAFDDLLYDDSSGGDETKDDEILFFGGLGEGKSEDSGIVKVVHIHGIEPSGFDAFYDILLGRKGAFRMDPAKAHFFGELP